MDLIMGCSEIDITPANPVQIVGFNRGDNTSQGIRDPLYAQASVWKIQEDICCLISIDHIGFSKEYADELRTEIGKIILATKEKVMLCFSHTHSAPDEEIETEYRKDLFIKIGRCVKEAMKNMHAVYVGWGNAFADIGFNRRKGNNALDRRVGILKVTDAISGELRLILLRLTAHANVLKRDNYFISADYFGAVRNVMKKRYGCLVMLTQGAAGNVAPVYVCSDLVLPDACDERIIRSKTALDDMANEVERQVRKVFKDIAVKPVYKVSMYSKKQNLYSEVPEYKKAQEIAEEAYQKAGIDGNDWLKEIKRLRMNQIKEQKEEIEVQFFQLNEGCLCGAANEFMCEIALNIWEKTRNGYCYFGGYTNGCTGYFPTEEEFDEGGYEVYWSMLIYFRYYGRVFPLNRASASRIIDFAVNNFRNE